MNAVLSFNELLSCLCFQASFYAESPRKRPKKILPMREKSQRVMQNQQRPLDEVSDALFIDLTVSAPR